MRLVKLEDKYCSVKFEVETLITGYDFKKNVSSSIC